MHVCVCLTSKIMRGKTAIANHGFFSLESLNIIRRLDPHQPLESPQNQDLLPSKHVYEHKQSQTERYTHNLATHGDTHTLKHSVMGRNTHKYTDILRYTQTYDKPIHTRIS